MMNCSSERLALASYSSIANRYDRLHERFLRFAGSGGQSAFEGAVLALLNPGMSVLDAACGTGNFATSLFKNTGGLHLTLLDACPEMLSRTPDLPVQKVMGQLEALPFSAASFDLVACAWGIETTARPSETVRELFRVVRPGGHLCMVTCANTPFSGLGGWIMKRAISIRRTGKFLDPMIFAEMVSGPDIAFARNIPCRGPALAMVIKKAE